MILEISRDRHDHGYSANEPLRPLMAAKNVYTVSEQPLGRARKIRIVGIGAGASGINMIRTLRLNLTDYELTVYEKNPDVGGTWFENRYPGCRCDIPSHNYQFSWRPKHDWSNFFAPAEEIGQYLREACGEEGMREAIKTSHQIVSARWNEQEGIWNLKVRRLGTETEFNDHAHFLVDGTGILNNWKWPVDEGLDSFQGTLIHTASWPEGFDPTGKVIAVIGNGASGIQVVPELQRSGAKTLYHVVRTPTWVPPPQIASWLAMGKARVLSEIQVDANGDFSQETIQKFKSDPEFYRRFVKEIEILVSNNFKMMIVGSREQAWARMKVAEYMKLVLGGDEKLCNALIPDYPLGFRRMTPGHSYLQALTQPNVEVKTGGVRRFVREGLELESGEVLEVDAIVCASGFDTSFCPRFPILGRTGNLQDQWRKQTPKAYMSCAVAGMPNYFTFLGPNAPIGHGSVFTLSEHIAKYITGVIKKCQLEGIKSIAPSEDAVDDYFEHISAFMPRTAWNAPGRSWFTNGKPSGPVTALHPGSRIHFFDMLERFRGEDFEYTYDNVKQNRFAYLGNGFSVKEEEGSGADTTWYLDAPATIA